MSANWKQPVSVLVVVYSVDRQVLLLRRADLPDFWQSVTGSLEHGESPLQAARREVLEETGLESDIRDEQCQSTFEIRGAWRARYAPDVTHNVEHVFSMRLATTDHVTLNPDEHLSYRWLSPAAALALASSPTNRAAIRTLFNLPA